MGQMIKGITFSVNDSVTNTKLHQLVESATITKQVITDQTLMTDVAVQDQLLIYDFSADALKKLDVASFSIAIPDDAITTVKILDNAVTTAKIADNNVTTAKINASAVTTTLIADGNVTRAKLESSQQIPTGVMWDYFGTSAPTGWILLDGRTIGNASSGASNRANTDTVDLFTLLWNSLANTEAAVSSGRGASAAADYAANKTLTLPDARGRILVGKDDMGGSAASRMTSGGSGLDGATLGKSGGAQTYTLATTELPAHNHGATGLSTNTTGAHTHTAQVYSGSITSGTKISQSSAATASTTDSSYVNSNGDHSHTISGSTANAGTGNAHNNVQPSLIVNKIIKL